MPAATTSSGGLSPRVRGNRAVQVRQVARLGSIPARAGEPAALAGQREGEGVYPRACGGTALSRSDRLLASGLSPRVRGNPPPWPDSEKVKGSIPARAGEPSGDALARSPPGGSIPARAGEPGRKSSRIISWKVYPRACGGTVPLDQRAMAIEGLSPRVRGNHGRSRR